MEAKNNVYCTHTVKHGYNVQYLVQNYLYRGEKKRKITLFPIPFQQD